MDKHTLMLLVLVKSAGVSPDIGPDIDRIIPEELQILLHLSSAQR